MGDRKLRSFFSLRDGGEKDSALFVSLISNAGSVRGCGLEARR